MGDDTAEKPLAFEAYETLAEAYAAMVDEKPHNAYYERPATLSLLPEVKGKQVLDAGCGPGVYTEWLADRGAQVTALDASEKMVRLARARVGAKAHVRQADLTQPLDFLADESFDLIVSALVFDYIKDWESLFKELYRVLRLGGQLVFSVGHPFGDFLLSPEGSYFDTELVVYEWRGFGVRVAMPAYRRPLGALIAPLLDAGFMLERLLEPQPTEEFKRRDLRHYEELMRQPGFLCVRAVKMSKSLS